ncbi:MAG: DNA mismatch repair protein MutS [Chitinophagales bacterium]|nr:DNA mismatch repair protein MutS [Chitinophagales bacterium]
MAGQKSMGKNRAVESETPLMKQYNQIKGKYPDAILLFRVGDFYETFAEDARKAAATLGIVLTKRSNGKASEVDLAGFPHHALDTYLPKLVKAGHRVAICDQLEDPKLTKTIVKRGVTEMVTPGIALGDNLTDNRSNNFLASVYFEGLQFGVAFVDVSTGEFFVAEGNYAYIDKLLQSLSPAEVLYQRKAEKDFNKLFGEKHYSYRLEDWIYNYENALDALLKLFGTHSLKGFGIEDEKASIIAAGAVLQYLKDTEHNNLGHLTKITRLREEKYVWLDRFTIQNLELVEPVHRDGKSLLDVLDKTVSPMGSRLLRRWLLLPLVDVQAIENRLDMVEYFLQHEALSQELKSQIKAIGDLERLAGKVSLQKVSPREMVQLKRALVSIANIQKLLQGQANEQLLAVAHQLNALPPLFEKIDVALVADAPAMLNKGNVIKEGYHAALDELRAIQTDGKDFIAGIQKTEVERTGISSLKIGFNNVFGYYLEVTNSHKNKVPPEWIRKQTLTNAERYITPELKVYEEKVLGAGEKIQAIEEQLFMELVQFAKDYVVSLQMNAALVATLDCLLCFAECATAYNYARPQLNNSFVIDIKSARHPVIEQRLPLGESYIPNDIFLDCDSQQILVITGPNMAGKSALLRQTALIVLMAQAGCFVPAIHANIGYADKIFTRVGASDNLSGGESTFMVEMNETAGIMNNLSQRSLILLDEIGRGTSTYDGVSIAWSIVEFLHNNTTAHPRTLFATHYHELNELAGKYKRIKNFHVTVKEAAGKIIFLRKLESGGSEHSFGIHVAKMAGMPVAVLNRANEVLQELESKRMNNDTRQKVKNISPSFQLSIFETADPTLKNLGETLSALDVNTLTPIEALIKLNELKRLLGN